MKKSNMLKYVFSVIAVVSTVVVVNAEMSTVDKNKFEGAVASEWLSTNIREWLNSDKDVVEYTAMPPNYSSEQGFLSNKNFTQSERDGIAVTRHGAGWQYSISNESKTDYYSMRGVAHNDYIYNDKVFILHYTDLVNYIEKNNILMEHRYKYYSNYIQNQTNKRDPYPYTVNSGYYNGGYTGTNPLYTSTLSSISPNSENNNIVPALSLKPNYVLRNGVKARDLIVGSTVVFGKYNNEPIEWTVINVSDEGYPLLWSSKIIITKKYDSRGDINPNSSNVINFGAHDVDIASGNGQSKSWETGKKITSSPVINILNEAVLTTPTNNLSFDIDIHVTDSESRIRRIILPDGRVINGDRVTYTVKNNGEFDIIAENENGVITVRHVVTKAINTPAEILLTTDKTNNTKWSNKPVNINISASNNGVYETISYGNREMGYRPSNSKAFPDWMALGGKRMRVTGTLRNAMTEEQAATVNMDASVLVRMSIRQYSIYSISPTYPIIKQFSLRELMDKGEIVIDEVITIQSNAYSNVMPYVTFMDGNSAYMKEPYNYWMSDFKYEILDKDDLQIEAITLPDGKIINGDTASYVASKDGVYNFSVRDNRGKVTEKSIDLKFDMDSPTANFVKSTESYVSDVVKVTVNASDTTSGIKNVKLPNGEVRSNTDDMNGLSFEYNFFENGKYNFEIEDFAGNKSSKSVTITNIDKEKPVMSLVKDTTNWTNANIFVSVNASDAMSGVGRIILPNGREIQGASASFEVSQNGVYSFRVLDAVGNESVQSIEVSNIDKVKPSAQINIPRISTSRKITVDVNAIEDDLSGAKSIRVGYSPAMSGATNIVDVLGVKNKSISVELPHIDNPEENYSVRTVYVEVIDKAGNKNILTATCKYDAKSPNKPTIVGSESGIYASATSGVDLSWVYGDKNADPSPLVLKNTIIRVYDSNDKVVYTYNVSGGATEFNLKGLAPGVYTIDVEVFNSAGKSAISDRASMRWGVHLDEGNVATVNIKPNSLIRYVRLDSGVAIPGETGVDVTVFFKATKGDAFTEKNSIKLELTNGVSSVKDIVLPISSHEIKIVYKLKGSKSDATISPILDSIKVYAK